MSAPFTIAPLADTHNRTDFDCSVVALNTYLQMQAGQDVRRHIANCFVASPAATSAIAGYYTLSSASILIDELGHDIARRLPRYPVVPAARIGRLAIDHRYQGRGLGGALLYDAVKRALHSDAAVFAMLVDAKDDRAVQFYRRHGFASFNSRSNTLYLPIATAKRL